MYVCRYALTKYPSAEAINFNIRYAPDADQPSCVNHGFILELKHERKLIPHVILFKMSIHAHFLVESCIFNWDFKSCSNQNKAAMAPTTGQPLPLRSITPNALNWDTVLSDSHKMYNTF